MNILSIYFSATNNTKYINDKIKLGVSEKHKFNEINVGDTTLDTSNYVFNKYDLYIIGGPVHVEVYPDILVDFVKEHLCQVDNKKIILYLTSASVNPPAIYSFYKLFKKNNQIIGMTAFEMSNNFYMNGMFEYTEEDERKVLLQKVDYKISELLKVINNESDIFIDYTINKVKYTCGKSVYNLLKNNYLKNYSNKRFSSTSECTGCGLCKKECPTNNINVVRGEKKVAFNKECIACTRCIHICPFEAISYNNEKIRKFNMLQ